MVFYKWNVLCDEPISKSKETAYTAKDTVRENYNPIWNMPTQ